MASAGDDVVEKFQEFCSLAGSKDKTMMTSMASGKMVADCFDKHYKKYDVKSICDASVFPAFKEKGKQHMVVNKANVDKYICKTAHEIAKRKTNNTKIAENDPEVDDIKADLCHCLSGGGPNVKVIKTSVTGHVDSLTDTSHYTGTHKERFDTCGKGKGIEGRVDREEHTGYVKGYHMEGTYDQHK